MIQRRRGKGTSRFRSPGHRFIGAISIRQYDNIEKTGAAKGVVKELYIDVGKNAPMLKVIFNNKDTCLYPAPFGIVEGSTVESGINSAIKDGNILPLGKIPDGTNIYCIEQHPGTGPLFVRTSGSSAKILSHDVNGVTVQMPSKKTVVFQADCRAIVGKISGSGRKEKPFVKASAKRFAKFARNKFHARVKGTVMNAGVHPHGGGQRRRRKNYSVSHNAPPGAKVGSISPRRTGRRNK
ncbi:50S ribosomal protein L2 [Candidatus Tiddalikarchaeum anstoanum]|nr:50S ribosomal protein L2 [Candidatus Tiddalikarchaeum anstoanum]